MPGLQFTAKQQIGPHRRVLQLNDTVPHFLPPLFSVYQKLEKKVNWLDKILLTFVFPQRPPECAPHLARSFRCELIRPASRQTSITSQKSRQVDSGKIAVRREMNPRCRIAITLRRFVPS